LTKSAYFVCGKIFAFVQDIICIHPLFWPGLPAWKAHCQGDPSLNGEKVDKILCRSRADRRTKKIHRRRAGG